MQNFGVSLFLCSLGMKFSFRLPDYDARSWKEFYENVCYETSRQRKIFKLGCYKRFRNCSFFLVKFMEQFLQKR